MNKTLFIAFASAIALGSCTNNEIDSPTGGTDGLIPINISTYVPRATRTYVASSSDIWDLINNGFTFTAINDVSHRTHIAGTTFYVKDPDTGVCGDRDETPYFWPRDSAVSFYAVYPTASDDEASGRTWLYAANDSLVFTPDGREDVLAAYASGSASSTDGSVQLIFKHVSAKVALAVRCDNADYNYALTSVVLTAPTKASYKFSTPKISVVVGSDSTEYASVDSDYNERVDVGESFVIFDTLFIAADGTAGSTCRLDVSYVAKIGNIERSYTKSATVNIVAGYENTVRLKLECDKPLSISVVANGWTADNEIDANGHEYVDLGLPSGLLWATCNVGAESPEEYGDYFAWGETETKDSYGWGTYAFGMESELTKYCINSSDGSVDGKSVLESADDAAAVNWGGTWRMPTQEEWQELIDNTSSAWTTQSEMTGCLFSASNGNSIFLPAVGSRSYQDLESAGSGGYYWTSSLSENSSNFAYRAFLSSDYIASDGSALRYFGFAVRPVLSYGPRKADF